MTIDNPDAERIAKILKAENAFLRGDATTALWVGGGFVYGNFEAIMRVQGYIRHAEQGDPAPETPGRYPASGCNSITTLREAMRMIQSFSSCNPSADDPEGRKIILTFRDGASAAAASKAIFAAKCGESPP